MHDARIPPSIVDVARKLHDAGHSAVVVGGAVRDALLGLPASDWDLATSATPAEVQRIFSHTIPTGIEHGTVTVMAPDPDHPKGVPVEVTTFRGEGDYVDGRRPSSVRFLRDLQEDLARRDFTVNAIAWNPIAETLSDPFGGLDDLRAGLIRAVGNAEERFLEDGLRTMRAVRLCATRRFELDPATREAIPGALEVLDRVSAERIQVELYKLLGAERPSLGLRPLYETGMWPHVFVGMRDSSLIPAIEAAIDAVDDLEPDPVLRLAFLLRPLGERDEGAVARTMDALRPSRADRARVLTLVSRPAFVLVSPETLERGPLAIREQAALLGREHIEDAIALARPEADRADAIVGACAGVPLTVGELAIKGGALIAEGIVSRGPEVGEMMRRLLWAVWSEPEVNHPARLLELARTLAAR